MDEKIARFPFVKERAVIINCGTRLTTTLAILSSVRYLDMPLLVIDCPLNKDTQEKVTDFQYFEILRKNTLFDLIQLPLRSHGDTLDDLFLNLQSEYICLVDSDVEILNDEAIKFMRLYVDDEKLLKESNKIFGSGFVQVAGKGLPPQEKWFHMERMWIPFTYLKTSLIREGIKEGNSFNIFHAYNDYPKNQKLSRKIYKNLNKIQRKLPLSIYKVCNSFCNLFRKSYDGLKPSVLAYDTGSKIYKALKEKDKLFLGISFYTADYYCTHFCGVTRSIMYENEPVATDINDIDSYIRERLIKEYQFDFDEFNKAIY